MKGRNACALVIICRALPTFSLRKCSYFFVRSAPLSQSHWSLMIFLPILRSLDAVLLRTPSRVSWLVNWTSFLHPFRAFFGAPSSYPSGNFVDSCALTMCPLVWRTFHCVLVQPHVSHSQNFRVGCENQQNLSIFLCDVFSLIRSVVGGIDDNHLKLYFSYLIPPASNC